MLPAHPRRWFVSILLVGFFRFPLKRKMGTLVGWRFVCTDTEQPVHPYDKMFFLLLSVFRWGETENPSCDGFSWLMQRKVPMMKNFSYAPNKNTRAHPSISEPMSQQNSYIIAPFFVLRRDRKTLDEWKVPTTMVLVFTRISKCVKLGRVWTKSSHSNHTTQFLKNDPGKFRNFSEIMWRITLRAIFSVIFTMGRYHS